MPHSIQLVHLSGLLHLDAQLIVSIGQKADPAMRSLGSIVYFWRKQAQTGAFKPFRLPPSQRG
jgi:hypothetical protein